MNKAVIHRRLKIVRNFLCVIFLLIAFYLCETKYSSKWIFYWNGLDSFVVICILLLLITILSVIMIFHTNGQALIIGIKLFVFLPIAILFCFSIYDYKIPDYHLLNVSNTNQKVLITSYDNGYKYSYYFYNYEKGPFHYLYEKVNLTEDLFDPNYYTIFTTEDSIILQKKE